MACPLIEVATIGQVCETVNMEKDQQSKISVKGMTKACRIFRSHDHMSMATSIPVSIISDAINGRRALAAHYAVKIEQATNGEVKRYELRPDMFDAPEEARSLDAFAAIYSVVEAGDLKKKHPPRRQRAAAKGKPKPAKKKVK